MKRDAGSLHGSGRSPWDEMETHSSILAWEIPWTVESCGIYPWVAKGHT